MSPAPGHEEWTGPVADVGDPRTVRDVQTRFEGRIWRVRSEDVDFAGGTATRDLVVHPGAVAVIALWLCFHANYPITRDIYFTLAMAHVLAEIPFLLRAL